MGRRSDNPRRARQAGGERARKLLALNHFANPYEAPGGTRLIELTDRLDGWATTIVAADRNLFTREVQPPPTSTFRTVWTTPHGSSDGTRILNWMAYAVGAFVLGLRGARPDVVYASSPHLLTGLAGWGVARLRRAGFVLEIRDLWPQILVDTGRLDPSSVTYRLVKGLERFLYARADVIVVLAQGVADALRDDGVADTPIWCIPNAADPEDFVPSAPRHELRQRYGFDGVTIMYAGAHGPANGLDFVLDAAAEVRDEIPQVRFVLVGDGLSKPALMQRVRLEKLTNVVFLEAVPKQEIPDLLAATDAGLHVLADLPLFLYGVSPNKLFDYMAAGLPVLTNTAGEVGDIVKKNDAGLVVEPALLASGVRQLVAAGEGQRRSWGAHGQEFAARERNRSLMASLLAEVLDSLSR